MTMDTYKELLEMTFYKLWRYAKPLSVWRTDRRTVFWSHILHLHKTRTSCGKYVYRTLNDTMLKRKRTCSVAVS